MALVFAESFDSTFTPSPSKWTVHQWLVGTATPRTGTRYASSPTGTNTMRQALAIAERDSTLVVGFGFRINGQGIATILSLMSDTATTTHVRLDRNLNNALEIRAGNALPLVATSEANILQINVWHYIEIKSFLHDVNGTVEVRVDGSVIPVASFGPGDTKNAGTATVFDNVQWLAGGPGVHLIDDVYICNGLGGINNDFLGDVSIHAVRPNADGFHQTFNTSDAGPTHFNLVNELTPDTTTFVSSDVVGDKDTYEFTDPPLTTGVIPGVFVNLWARKDATGSRSVAPVVRHAGTDDIGTFQPVSQNYSVLRQGYDVNPVTGLPWTISDVLNAEFGVEVGA